MSIDGREEQIFPLTEAAARAEPIIGRRLALSTYYRWAGRGCKGIRLESRMLGGVKYTSVEALERFFDALTEAVDAHRSPPPASAPTRDRRAQIERANAELDKAGI